MCILMRELFLIGGCILLCLVMMGCSMFIGVVVNEEVWVFVL